MANLFSDLKVLDIATYIAGPGATTILSDFGADVIKIEAPGMGDPYRDLFKIRPNPESSKNYMWQLTNRNKRSMTLNLKSPGAQEAYRLGLVNEVVPAAQLMATAERWANEILECSPLSVQLTKEAALSGLSLPVEEAMRQDRPRLQRLFTSQDFVEGPKAFAEKRKPRWTGR